MAATGPHHHVLVLLEDDVGVVVEVEHRDGMQLGRCAAGLGHVIRVHEVHLREEGTHVQLHTQFKHFFLPLPLSRMGRHFKTRWGTGPDLILFKFAVHSGIQSIQAH